VNKLNNLRVACMKFPKHIADCTKCPGGPRVWDHWFR